MPTITIPQALIKEKELILIPRREYDKLLKKQTTKRKTKAVKRSASFHVPQKHHKFYEKLGFKHETTLKQHYYSDKDEFIYSLFFD